MHGSFGSYNMIESMALVLALLLAAIPVAAQGDNVLVVTAGSADYLMGAGGTLAKLALDGHQVYVAQFGNDEKDSVGLPPARTRWLNIEEGRQAAEFLGFRDTIYLAHKSGEIGYIPSTEMREQLFALIRHLRPQKIFIPDPYVHYQQDRDVNWVGQMAEEAWGYSGSATFAPGLARMGLKPYSTPEVYYYAAGRPYRGREGGEGRARLVGVDIGDTAHAKRTALGMLTARRLSEMFVDELARAIGAKHGFRYGEEFNYVGPGQAIPAHIREKAVRK
jgi:LmbE family N-acetylglucosaminyl deacetylase